MSRKIPISFSNEVYNQTLDIAELLGIKGIYGDFPKALKFSITFTLSALRNPEKVYTDLDTENLDYYFNSIKANHLLRKKAKELQDLQKQLEKV